MAADIQRLRHDGDRVTGPDDRTYPRRPIVGVGAVIFADGDRVVLVRRRHPPLVGSWSLPGGAVEVGETLEQAVRREVNEETGLDVEVGPLVAAVDHIERDLDGNVVFHFVIVDYLCRARGGVLTAGGDAGAVRLAGPAELDSPEIAERTRDVIARGWALSVEPLS